MKKRRILKTISLAGLAVVMATAGILAFAPIGASASTPPPTTTTGLGLDPKNDPVVYTTESGLEIKKSNGKYSSTTTTTTNSGQSYIQDLTSFYYFTMGTFSGTIYTAKTKTDTYTVTNEPVNWLIIGRGGFDFYDNTPAGGSIENDSNKQEFAVTNNLYLPLAMQSIPQNDEIPDGCFLVLSERLLGNMYFNSSGSLYTNFYTSNSITYSFYSSTSNIARYRTIGNTLYTYINNLFSKNNSTGAIEGENQLGFTQSEANFVVPQQLYTYYYNSGHTQETPQTDGSTYYTMFPLAYREANSSIYQNFCVEDYLPDTSQRVASYIKSNQSFFWYLRSGNPTNNTLTTSVSSAGSYYTTTYNTNTTFGVRPAFVLSLQ